MNFFDLFFHESEIIVEPEDGYLSHIPSGTSMIRPGTYSCFGREVKVLGFCDDGKLSATLYLNHRGSGECSEWGTLTFSRLSSGSHDEIWDCIVDKCAIVLHATDHGGKLKIKIEVDK